jgi:aspartate aminotransferase
MRTTPVKTDFSKALQDIRMSPIVTISELAKERAAALKEQTGEDFIYFQRGEIDYPTPDYIVNAAKQAMADGKTKYPRSGGEAVFKQAVIDKMARVNNAHGLKEENILCTYGGQEALQLAFKLFDGKKGSGFAPAWSCALENFIPYAGIDFNEVPLNNDFSMDVDKLEEAISQSAFFYLNTPQNPTGKVFTEEECKIILEICEKHGTYLISDEAYERIIIDEIEYFSPSSMESDLIISCFTLSKTYAMTGWRIGYLVCRDPEVVQLGRLGDYSQTAGVVTFIQYAAAEAISNVEAEKAMLDPMLKAYRNRRDLLYKLVSEMEGVEVTKPQGAFYLFPNFSNIIPENLKGEERDLFIFNKLLDKGVAVVYGACFGSHFGDNVRLSYSATDEEQIKLGVERINDAIRYDA